MPQCSINLNYILNIETATTVCSVSLSKNGELIAFKELNAGYTHAENLHSFIQNVLEAGAVSVNDLRAVAVSKGPGSYTGLRIGVSAAKGLAYALNIPLISLDTLQVMAEHELLDKNNDSFYCPMIDARRMEVFTALYDKNLGLELPVHALVVDEESIKKFEVYPRVYFFGDGMPKCRTILQQLPNAVFVDNILPSAKYMTALSFEKFEQNLFEDLAYFEPFYLKDFLIMQKK